MIKSTGIDFFTFYATTGAVKCNHQFVVATTGAFTLTSVIMALVTEEGAVSVGNVHGT